MTQNYFIIAGEPSADTHGASLMKEMLSINSDINFAGIGGHNMKALGQDQLFSSDQMAIMGFTEVIRHLKFLKNAKKTVVKHIISNPPDKIILIDYPGFNLRLAKELKKISNIPIIYYISPQIWAWKENRIKTIKKYVDKMIVILPFEKDWYRERGLEVEYVGHPILDQYVPAKREVIANELSIDQKKPILTLFPGSRKQELHRHLKLFLDSALLVKKEISDLQIILGLAKEFDLNEISQNYDLSNIKIEQKNPISALEIADVAIVASGTSTLEAAVYETPSVIVYKLSTISWLISKLIVKVPFAGLVNLIANKEVFPELLQDNATTENISKSVSKILLDEDYRNSLAEEIQNVKTALGGSGASNRVAQLIMYNEN
ncbi:MAG: lipid-A-disaccharide synthase [Candidatus Marinimicrobia bacterium]|nr:lipid-A-disaccharide synthase [Candidatus Neomarinimicrobiota bacterium]MBL7108717.1 lipid-A-disaccharide synthase [Candidatus Neomarinimicrobiota bacterium]